MNLEMFTPAVGNNPLVSIVVPVHNGEAFIAETIESVLAQTHADWELILINDGSSDRSMEIIEGYLQSRKIRAIDLEQNVGAAKARNAGIMAAQGQYLCFLDADDLWVPEKLEKQVEFMLRKDCAFSFTGYEFADASGRPNGKAVSVPPTMTYRQALRNTTIWTSTVMFDMMKLTKNDVLMPDVASEDTATWWRILKKIKCAYGLDETLSIYRRSGKTLSSNKVVAIKRIWGLYRDQEGLNVVRSSANFMGYAFNAVRRRV